jgi:Chitobiase/beta-hexosaminidase C-terminal domain/Regulator of chromosome condensation (RCC1) repeat
VLALKSDGTVWSWGINTSGQLGTQPISGSLTVFPPARVQGLSNIQSIAAAFSSSFAVGRDGTVWAWGSNWQGQLGDGTTTERLSPVALNTISDVRSISTSGDSTYVIKNDGTLWSWGSNIYGLLGNGSSASSSLVPVKVVGLSNVRAVASEYTHTIALQADGTVWTWGNNISAGGVPVQVNGLTNATAVAAGTLTLLALKADGTVWMWGNGQPTPARVEGLSGTRAIAAAAGQHMAIMSDNSLQMWGYNGYGELGDGTLIGRNIPAPVKWLAVVATPKFSPEGSTYVFPKDVAISCETDGAVIHYTTNGAEPTESDPIINSGGTLRIDSSVMVKAKAWKNGWTPSKVSSTSYTIGVTSPPPPATLQLILAASSPDPNQAAALDSILFLRDPFPIVNAANLLAQAPDRNTRVILFVTNLQLAQGEAASSVTVNLIGSNNQSYDIAAEDVRPVPDFSFTQVVFRLPDNLAPGTCTIKLKAHGQESNSATIRIKS